MAYIGRQLVRGQNRVLDDISSSFNGSTTAFNLTVSSSSSPPASVNQLWIILGGVLQKPGTDFTVADAVLTFTTAPASTLSFWGMIQGDTSDINSPADASVTPSKIANSGDFAFPADVRFNDADGSHYVGLQAPSTVSSNLVWSLPAADGSANQLLKTDGSGNLGWASDSTTDSTKLPLAGGTLTGNLTISNTAPSIIFTDTDHDSDFTVYGSSGSFTIRDVTNSVNRFNIASDGTISLTNDLSIADKIIHTGDTNTAVRFPAADTITFETSGSERLRIDSSGSLGIGTTPETDGQANSLYFANGNANLWGSGNVNFYTCVNARYTGSAWKYNNTAAASYVGQQSGVWNFFNAPSGTADDAVTFTERFRIDSSGNVGIGTTSPQRNLHIHESSAASAYLHMTNDTTGAATTDGFSLYVATDGQTYYRARETTGTHRFYTAGSERLRVDSNGAVQIGTTAPITAYTSGGNKLTVFKADGNGGVLELGGSTDTNAYNAGTILFYNNTNANATQWQADSKLVGLFRAEIITTDSNAGDDSGADLTFYTKPEAGAGGLAMTIHGEGNVSIDDGDLVLANGHGIDFSATSGTGTSEILHDYECGTFTPTWHTESAAATFGYHTQKGFYVKIGRMVYFQVYIRLNSSNAVSGGSGSLVCQTLPFTPQDATTNPNVAYGTVNIGYTNAWSGDNADRGLVSSSAAKFYVYIGQSSGTNVVAGAGNLGNSTQFRASGSYVAA